MSGDGLERLRRWREQDRGVPPAFGRLGARLEQVALGQTVVRLPLSDELRRPDGAASAALSSLLADFGLTTSVIATLPDLRGVTTVAMTVDFLALPPTSGALDVRASAGPYAGGGPQWACAEVHDLDGRPVARATGWLMPAEAEPASAERVGLVTEPPATHLLDLLRIEDGALHAREALSNALGTLHGSVGALATQLAAEDVLRGEGAALPSRTATFAFLRPTPRDGTVRLRAEQVRRGRRTGAADATATGPDGRTVLRCCLVAGA